MPNDVAMAYADVYDDLCLDRYNFLCGKLGFSNLVTSYGYIK